jgi:hypothetical protein
MHQYTVVHEIMILHEIMIRRKICHSVFAELSREIHVQYSECQREVRIILENNNRNP